MLVNRFPGVAYWAAPAYALAGLADDQPTPSHPLLVDPMPARVTAAFTAAAVTGVLFVLLRTLVSAPAALAATVVIAAGTSLWSVAANALWRQLPGWTKASALAAVAYLVVQVRVAGHAGGDGFFAYRVSLESLALAVPALAAATVELARRHRAWSVAVALLAATSIGIHAWGAASGGIAEPTQRRWEQIDGMVREQYGGTPTGSGCSCGRSAQTAHRSGTRNAFRYRPSTAGGVPTA